jgi:hypothetical protein
VGGGGAMSVNSWCVKRKDEYGNRHDELVGYMPPGHMSPLYVVEDYGEWALSVYEDGVVLYVDYYGGFAEIAFNAKI